ncbi:hypothetical protein V8G54_019859 [Vigna mungo]|uniref:Uncharacterized protein n=1 Tax=Vigna mungo TaxID=3915 RepID=A0AAQ3RVD2_VIGMU
MLNIIFNFFCIHFCIINLMLYPFPSIIQPLNVTFNLFKFVNVIKKVAKLSFHYAYCNLHCIFSRRRDNYFHTPFTIVTLSFALLVCTRDTFFFSDTNAKFKV